jgi:hypothetical protein
VRDVEVPAPRRQLKTSSKPSIDPSPGPLEESLTTKWGATLNLYSPLKITGTLSGASIDRNDMAMLLNLPGNSGWLSNYTIDAFFTTLMPQFSKALQPGLLRIFLPAFISKHVQEYGTLPGNCTDQLKAALGRTTGGSNG